MPDLQIARAGASSCCLSGFIYIFGGRISNVDFTNKIERLNLSHLHDQATSNNAWELFEPSESEVLPRSNSAMVSFSDTEFIILGGLKDDDMSGVSLHNTANTSTNGSIQHRTITENDAHGHIKFRSWGN